MADGIYVSMNGAAARLAQLDALSDNLANAQTPGFKASRPAFEAFLPRAAQAGQARQVHPAAVATHVDLSPGAAQSTGHQLDVIPAPGAFLAVQLDGGVGLTRNGALKVSPDGRLTAAGLPLLDAQGNTITLPPQTQPQLTPEGLVLAGGVEVARLAQFTVAGPLDRVAPTVLRAQSPGDLVPVVGGLRLGELELGNASALEATLQLVSAQRSFDTAMQAVQTYRRLDERAIEVGRLR